MSCSSTFSSQVSRSRLTRVSRDNTSSSLRADSRLLHLFLMYSLPYVLSYAITRPRLYFNSVYMVMSWPVPVYSDTPLNCRCLRSISLDSLTFLAGRHADATALPLDCAAAIILSRMHVWHGLPVGVQSSSVTLSPVRTLPSRHLMRISVSRRTVSNTRSGVACNSLCRVSAVWIGCLRLLRFLRSLRSADSLELSCAMLPPPAGVAVVGSRVLRLAIGVAMHACRACGLPVALDGGWAGEKTIETGLSRSLVILRSESHRLCPRRP